MVFFVTAPALQHPKPCFSPQKCVSQPPLLFIRACIQPFKDPITRDEQVSPVKGDPEVHSRHVEAQIEALQPDENEHDKDDEQYEDEKVDKGADQWYDIVDHIEKEDTYETKPQAPASVMNLAELDELGREALTSVSYHAVVDVDIEKGGMLPDDEDNNDLFCGLGLDALVDTPQLVKNLRNELKIETATHVQLAAVPRVADGRDIVVQSHTGTGKTLAFLLPMLDNIQPELKMIQGIVIAPTRELAMQIFREVEKLIKGLDIIVTALIGGANPVRQVEKLRRQTPHVVVGTPGRLAELHSQKELRLNGTRMMVVDEVDQSIGEAFVKDVSYLLHHCARKVQKVLVSATSDVDAVRGFATKYLHKPLLLRVGGAQRLPKQIEHWYCVVPARMRIELLRKLMNTDPPPQRAIAFVDEPRRVDMVAERLFQMNVVSGTLRGTAHKLERAEVLAAFRKGQVPLMITTEIAARGLDIPEVTHVFNIDLPTDGDHYIHRAGRCGRVRNSGTVVSFTTAETAFVIGRIEKETGVQMTRMEPREGKYVKVVSRGEVADGAVEATRKSSHGAVRPKEESAKKITPSRNEKREAKAKSVDAEEQKKARAKVRARDLKNKGKPKGRPSRRVNESLVSPGLSSGKRDGEREVEKERASDEISERKEQKLKGGPRARHLHQRALREGWVGNR